ncbi:MAG: 1-acyl-sn-glycerol-3-phosphate acyltransferase [Anaerolineae bacterium]
MFLKLLEDLHQKGLVSEKIKAILEVFYESYHHNLITHQIPADPYEPMFIDFLNLIKEQVLHPFSFQPYHRQICHPFDHYQFGIDFLKPLVDLSISSAVGLSHLDEIVEHLKLQHNVILLANHQTEADPQAISILLEKTHPEFAKELIFVAGERVITDPLAIPFSMGRNLLCIYSKRYIDHPPEQKLKKQLHNKRTMELMSELLKEGGKSIYVAPSGGRDRPNVDGVVEIAPFDPQSIEMFYLMAKKAAHPTFFYPLTLATYDLLPPPQTVQRELGEVRLAKRGGIHLAFGAQIDMEHFPGSDLQDKHERRKARAEYIWNLVKKDYSQFC